MAATSRAHRRFAEKMSDEDKLLVDLRDEIYGGSWRRLKTDLADRLGGKPYVVKLAGRIQDDLDRIKKIAGYERTHGIDITDFMPRREAQ